MEKTLFKNFYVRSSLFTILSLGSAVTGYALYPILVRLLTPEAFGDFAVAAATLNQVLAILLAINVISIHLVKKYGEDEARQHAQVIQKVMLWFFLFITLIVLALSPLLSSLFKISDAYLFVPLVIILLTSLPLIVWTGYLQGHKELVRIGIFSFGSAIAKLIFTSLLGLVAGSVGAFFGVLVGTITGIIIIYLYPGVRLPSIGSVFSKTSKQELRFLASLRLYIIEAVFVVGVLGILQNYDISLAKALFGPSVAGVYSGISILSNALYYLAFILIWIVLPEISINEPKINRRVLGTAYKLLGLLAVLAVGAELLLKDHLLPILLGGSFSDKTDLLLFATLYQLTLVAIALYSFYLLICRRNRSVVLVGLLLGACLLIPPYFATTPLMMIQALWLSSVLAVVTYVILVNLYKLISRRPNKTQTGVIQ